MAPTPQGHLSNEQEILSTPTSDGERIVISGMSGLYPASRSVKELSEILYNKVNPVTEADIRFKYNHPEVPQHAGSVPGLSRFDAQFFKVHYRLANSMDPMARKVLEQSYQAIYDAGINPEELSGKKVGVYIGSCFSETEKACFYEAASRSGFGIAGHDQFEEIYRIQANVTRCFDAWYFVDQLFIVNNIIKRCSKTMFANRISYWLNAKGPSMSIDEACCSSTAALEQAYLAMSRGECEAAIVGGTYLCLHPQSSVHYGRIMKLSRDGKTKSFDENADGCAKSEAINVLFLQKAKDALRIYADVLHVKSEFICMLPGETGPKYGFYRDVDKTANFIKTFYEEARIPADAVEYVEAFGCAVLEADKVELQAIEQVFCDKRDDPLLVGSVMSNIGYNEAASGISAITKVLLGYHHGELAANLHCSSPRQDLAALREGRMRITTEHERFGRTYVAVNGMSVTGINSHVLLHGHYKPKDAKRYMSSLPYLVTISARQESAVTYMLDNLKSNPIDPEQLRLLHNIHQTSISGHLGRGFIILKNNEEQKTVSLCEKSEYFDDARRPLWFVYSGMGSQWAGMGTQLMHIPIFAAAIERCRQVLEPRGLDIIAIITSPDETFDNILHSFVGIAAIQIGLTDVLRELGLVPDAIIGHSVGELGCAYADGCLTAEEMILSAYSRGLVSLQTPFIRGSMAAIGLGYEQISKLCPPEIEVACHNGAESSTISGPADVMREFVAELTAKGIFAKEVPCSNIAYHSRYIADAGPLLLQYLSEVIKTPKPRTDRWLSTSVPQDRWSDPSAKLCSAEYHTNNLLSSVLFEETSRLVPNNAVLVEVAPHGLLQAILKRSLPNTCKNIALTRRKHPDNVLLLLEGIGTLFMEGYNPKVHVLYPKVELPVSTGTPFLSHLVEWAHGERWPMPLYRSANRKTAANCEYVISVHDSENTYLQGHSMRGHNLYPFAASLVLVWDTLAMVMGVPKKQLSVEFSDLHLHSQPILHDQRQLRLSVALHRGTGRFEILNEGSKVATGYINAIKEVQEPDTHIEAETKLNADYTVEDIYHLLRDKDYSYSGEFRSISCTNKFMTEAEVFWCNNWVTLIDGLLQLNALRQPLTSFSLPTHIRRMCIDIKKHEKAIQRSTMTDDKVLMKTEVLEIFDVTRCGGVTINNVKWENVPPINDKTMTLKALRFVPYFKSIIDASSSLQVYLQIVSENVNKANIKVVEIINQPEKGSIFTQINDDIRNVFGVDVTYEQVTRESALEKQNNLLGGDADLVIVQNLSTDDKLCQLLHRVLIREQFVVSEENLNVGGNSRPSSLYRVLSSHTIVDNGNSEQAELQLVRWGPSAASATTAVTVRTHSDSALLTSIRNSLSPQQRLLVLAHYPPPRGLKELVNGWRREANRNKIHLIMATKDSNDNFTIDEVPDIDLAFNVFDSGTWGGEYYVPMKNTESVSNNVTLESKQIGDYDSLTWVEAPDNDGLGVTVKVHYAGINNDDMKRASGFIASQNKKKYGMDFSGVTDNGQRVMGLVPSGAVSSVVRARPELLWPVPAHWSLEDAATVPLAYAHAFYCLVIKRNLQPTMSVMVHGGAGALGQATIALALAHGCQVYTTVSDMQKKQFLLRLFPDLKANNVGSSRDSSFKDLILSNTKGVGCDIVINSLRGDLKEASIHCVGIQGICLDTSQLHNRDADFAYGMSHLCKERAYANIDFSAIFENTDDLKVLHRLLSEGISRGYVRPLSRVTYAPHDAARAFHLLAASRHRGRVLLRMQESLKQSQSRLTCNADRSHLIFYHDETFGLQLADRLVERGVKKLCVHCSKQSLNYLQMKIRSWQNSGVQVSVFTDILREERDVTAMLNNVLSLGPLEGIYVTITDNQQNIQETLLSNLDSASRKLCPDIKYFAILNIVGNTVGKEVCLSRVRSQLPATMMTLPELSPELNAESTLYRAALEATENGLRGQHAVVLAHSAPTQQHTLLQKIAALADITILENNTSTTLKELGMENDKIQLISKFLRVHYNLVFEEKEIPLLTVDRIQKLENTIIKSDFEDVKSLSTFFTYVDSDELLATTDMVFLPTLVNSALMRDDEFDVSQTYLFVVPGMEGHYERFRVLCERLKLPALVLQPGLDRLHESVLETAERYAETLLKKTGLKNNFYLLGYESGVSIALEMAAILEDHGLKGTVYCIGYGPEEFKIFLERQLSDYESDEQLQDAVVRHMFELMTGHDMTATVEKALQAENTWSQKVEACVRGLLGRVPHSAQYARALIDTALARIERARRYVPHVRTLRSQLVLLRAANAHATTAPLALQRHSQRPVEVHQLRAPLAHAARDLRCAAIINAYLEPEIRENFEKKNICDTYLLNASSFMTIEQKDKISIE